MLALAALFTVAVPDPVLASAVGAGVGAAIGSLGSVAGAAVVNSGSPFGNPVPLGGMAILAPLGAATGAAVGAGVGAGVDEAPVVAASFGATVGSFVGVVGVAAPAVGLWAWTLYSAIPPPASGAVTLAGNPSANAGTIVVVATCAAAVLSTVGAGVGAGLATSWSMPAGTE